MGLEKLISIIATLVILAASTGQLPRLICEVRTAQIHLIQDTKASTWGMPMLLRGTVAPVALHLAIGTYYRAAEYREGKRFINPRQLREQHQFAKMWARNLPAQ